MMTRSILFSTTLMLLLGLSVAWKPSYTYECKEDHSIQFIGLYPRSNVTILNSTNCNNTVLNSTDGRVNINATCMTNKSTEATVLLAVYDPYMYTSTTPVPGNGTSKRRKRDDGSVTPTVSISGGRGTENYQLTCEFIPKNGTIKSAIKHFEGKDNDDLEPVNFDVDGIDIRFKPEDKLSSRDLSAIYVGDEFYMFIKYLGVHDYYVRPANCTAYAGRSTSSSVNAVIWDDKLPCTPKDFDGTHVMEHFYSTNDNKIVYAKMYGFHFQGQQDITIKCEVFICNSVKCNNSLSCTSGYSKRKRRQSMTSQKHMSVQRSVHVYDSKLDTIERKNGANHPLHDLTLCYVATVFALVKRILS